jgi:oxygen-independent coproporphyrinogen-3 oxidase
MISSLYIHIPFCTTLCDYCDFYSVPAGDKPSTLMDSYIDAVLDDIKEQFIFFDIDHIPTVYIGGGTPSVPGAARMERLLAGIQALLRPMKQAPDEFTVEANPESADEDFLKMCAAKGVSRISLGVQTFHEPSRDAVNRIGGGKLLEERIALTAAYFPGFSADLITGLPFQTGEIVRNDIERLIAYNAGHISLYSLSLEPQTPLGEKAARLGAGILSLPCGDEADRLWIMGRDTLKQNGFTQYEVSNFARPGKACVHNIRYWRMENWLGIGPAASGTIIDEETGTGKRSTYPETIDAYLAAPSPHLQCASVETINKNTLMQESLLMGFRYREGPDPLRFKQRFGIAIEECIPQTIARWRERGFFAADNCLAPSSKGLLFLNGFLREAFEELLVVSTTNYLSTNRPSSRRACRCTEAR